MTSDERLALIEGELKKLESDPEPVVIFYPPDDGYKYVQFLLNPGARLECQVSNYSDKSNSALDENQRRHLQVLGFALPAPKKEGNATKTYRGVPFSQVALETEKIFRDVFQLPENGDLAPHGAGDGSQILSGTAPLF